jgi:hypothetical protein
MRMKTLIIIVAPKRNRSRHGGHLPRVNRIVLRPSRGSPVSQIFSGFVLGVRDCAADAPFSYNFGYQTA